MRRHVTIDIPAPTFAPVRDKKTGKLKPVGPFLNSNARRTLARKLSGSLLKLEQPRKVLDIPTRA